MLGCVLYELCSLKKPFHGDNIITLMNSVINDQIQEIPSTYSIELKNIVKILTDKDDSKRPFIREIIEMDVISKKMKEVGIEEIESPVIACKNNSLGSQTFSIKLNDDTKSIDTNDINNLAISIQDSKPSLCSVNSTESIKVGSNTNPNERFRKKVRVPEKLNKKYESMGHQAFENVINDMSLSNLEGTFLK